jgi:hypothetical protein
VFSFFACQPFKHKIARTMLGNHSTFQGGASEQAAQHLSLGTLE